uniref:Uncharacterized protein n=1 Tax=Salix viminalis TaxID=40686 RepID=A0A6N2L9S5_SALVM
MINPAPPHDPETQPLGNHSLHPTFSIGW